MKTNCSAPLKLVREANWWVATRPWSDSPVPTAEGLLRRQASLRGNSRLVRTSEGVAVMADVYIDETEDGAVLAEERVARWFDEAPATTRPDDELMEALLAERGLKVEKKEGAWAVTGQVTDVTIRRAEGGFFVEVLLQELDAADAPPQRLALAEFLCLAQEHLRFARLELNEAAALVVAWCDERTLAFDLPHALGSVEVARVQLIAQVRALVDPALSKHYLDFVVGRKVDGVDGAPATGHEPARLDVVSSEGQAKEIIV
jgi:hypothetical protein